MIELLQDKAVYLQYLVPPLVGAFIGYLTNKIAIRMLFRPLKPWYLFGIKVPMTPGVIPSKRHRLAVNIGKMVGGHLLTGKEIKKALRRQTFQSHLGTLIRERVGAILDKDLPPLPRLVPRKYGNYFNIGVKTVSYQTKQQIHGYIASKEFERRISNLIGEYMDHFLARDLDAIVDREKRDELYGRLQVHLASLLASREVELWIEDFLHAQYNLIISSDKSLDDLLPGSLREALLEGIEAKLPELIEKLTDALQDPAVQKKLVAAISNGIERFAQSLGPMGSMLQNFLNAETVEKAVYDYLSTNKEEIAAILGDRVIREKVCHLLLARIRHYLQLPLASFLSERMRSDSRDICRSASKKIAILLKEEKTAETLTVLFTDILERNLEEKGGELSRLASDFAGEENIREARMWLLEQTVSLFRSQRSRQFVNVGVDRLLGALIRKPVGRLSNFLPVGVRNGLYDSMRRISSAMLAAEVPGLVSSLNIEQIVAEKVDSLDLVRLEGLLLSIMEEQFKYINLFGALLGFLIGLLNVVVLFIL